MERHRGFFYNTLFEICVEIWKTRFDNNVDSYFALIVLHLGSMGDGDVGVGIGNQLGIYWILLVILIASSASSS